MVQRDIINGRFEIERRAGAGGMGTVFRALDRQTGGPVALKVINAGHSPELAERFQREIAWLAELSHPGIVRFVASGATEEGQAYLVMEWLDGEGLVERLARGTLSMDETIDLGRRVASALSVAHARGVIHRDLKPGNLFLPGGDLARVVILDFGIARAIDGGQSLTSTGATLGSPGYLSPEQARGTRDLDARADVFSLGCVLFHCLAGRAPFTGDLIQVMMATVMEPAPRVASLRQGVPPALEDLIQRMLAKSPDGRPRDAAAVFAELTALATPPAQPQSSARPSVGASAMDPRRITAQGTVALPSMREPPSPVAPRPPSNPPPSVVHPSLPGPRLPSAPPMPSAPPSGGWPTAPFALVSAPASAPMHPGSPYAPSSPYASPSSRPPAFAPAPATTGAATPYAVPPTPTPASPPRSSGRRWLIAAVGIALLAAGATALLLAYGDDLFGGAHPPVPAAKRKAR